MEIELSGNDPNEEIENAIEKGKKISSIAFVSKENNDIYEKNTKKIISFVKRD